MAYSFFIVIVYETIISELWVKVKDVFYLMPRLLSSYAALQTADRKSKEIHMCLKAEGKDFPDTHRYSIRPEMEVRDYSFHIMYR